MGKKSRDGDSLELRLGGERGAFRSPKIGPWPFYSQLLLPPSRLILPRPTCWASFVPGAEPRGREGSYFTSEQNKTSKMEKEFISHSSPCFVRSPSRVGRHIALQDLRRFLAGSPGTVEIFSTLGIAITPFHHRIAHLINRSATDHVPHVGTGESPNFFAQTPSYASWILATSRSPQFVYEIHVKA